MLTGNKAAAWGARLAGVEYVPAFPITPQTEIIETLSQWFADGTLNGKFTNMDSEHSMFMAAGSAAATGVRVFTASSSQGILYGLESIYTVAGWRVPFVVVNVSRALATPITLEADHNDVMSTRDCGLIQLYAETCQEVLDFVLMGYKISENPSVSIPVLVNMDGFVLSFSREPVVLPDELEARDFLPQFQPDDLVFRASRPIARASAVFGGGTYTYFRIQQDLAARQAKNVFKQTAAEFYDRFGRNYEPVERFATKGKSACLRLRKQGIKAGLLKLRLFRPFPTEEVAEALSGRPLVAVIDQNLSPGMGGITYPEIVTAMYDQKDRPQKILSVIGGLGGKDIKEEDFLTLVHRLQDPNSKGPVYLYDENDARQFEQLKKIAQK
jgi:pyruvate ferredoxin oxidoreductase alpha subunit